MKIGISTIYFSKQIIKNTISWKDILEKLKLLDLQHIELNADIPLSWMKEIQKDVEKKDVTVVSLHNFCPAVENIPFGKYGFNVYSLNSKDENERELAIKYTFRTIDYANSLQAEAVILHLGEIITEPSGEELYRLFVEYGVKSQLFQKYKSSFISSREKSKKQYFDLLYYSLDKIVKYAEEKKVKIAMETRFFPNEIPNFEEIGEIINYYRSKYLFYWHDFGHAELQIKLGFVNSHQNYFKIYKNYLLGYHIHNFKNTLDHFSPYEGDIDFSKLLGYLENRIYILEVHSKEPFEKLEKGVDFIKSILRKETVYEGIS